MTTYHPIEIAAVFGWRIEFIYRLMETSILHTRMINGEPIITLGALQALDELAGNPPKHDLNRLL